MIKRQHISFDHGPPVGSHSAGLAGVVGYLFFFLLFFRSTFSVSCLPFFSSVVVLSFFGENKTDRERERERKRERERYLGK